MHSKLPELSARVVLLVAGLSYVAFGAYQGIFGTGPAPATDMRLRWVEHHYVVHRQNPFDVWAAARGLSTTPGRDAHVIPEVGTPGNGGYPPWETALGLALVPPTPVFMHARIVLTGLSAMSLAMVAVWAGRLGASIRRGEGTLPAAAVLAVIANLFCLSAGQYALIANGGVILAWFFAEQRRFVLSGLTLSLAFIKPQIGAWFVLAFMVKGHWRPLAATALTLTVSSLAAAWLTHTPVPELVSEMFVWSSAWLSRVDGYGPVAFLLSRGVGSGTAQAVCGLAGGAALTVLTLRRRSAPPDVLFAIAATIGRLASYHGVYDNTMLVFLIVSLIATYYRSGRQSHIALAAAAVGLTLGSPVPYGLHAWAPLQALHVAVWVCGLVVLVRATRPAMRVAA
jgi:Glycosyltransferase family 87